MHFTKCKFQTTASKQRKATEENLVHVLEDILELQLQSSMEKEENPRDKIVHATTATIPQYIHNTYKDATVCH